MIQTSSIHRSPRSSGTVQGRDKSRDHAVTGSDDPEGAGKQVFEPKMSKAEAQLNRVRCSADTGSSEKRADSPQKSRKAPGRAKHLERGVCRQDKGS